MNEGCVDDEIATESESISEKPVGV